MSEVIDAATIQSYRERLENHPIFGAVRSLDQLRIFMEHHVYSVWDFMSLVKYLQQQIAPSGAPWFPPVDGQVARFINELVLEEESDEGLPDRRGAVPYASHFELYCAAMREVGADDSSVLRYLDKARSEGLAAALRAADIPAPAKEFNATTFGFIDSGKPHVVAAALAVGREHIIPSMFRALLRHLGVAAERAPGFHYYLQRHIHLDDEAHGPMSLRLLEQLCAGDRGRIEEAAAAAEAAVTAREHFWNAVLATLRIAA